MDSLRAGNASSRPLLASAHASSSRVSTPATSNDATELPTRPLTLHTNASESTTALLRVCQSGIVWLDHNGDLQSKLLLTDDAEPLPAPRSSPGSIETPGFQWDGRMGIKPFLRVARSITSTVQTLNHKGVFLRVCEAGDWGVTGHDTVLQSTADNSAYLKNCPFAIESTEEPFLYDKTDLLLSKWYPSIAPELVRESFFFRQLSCIDVYATAATLYEILVGRPCINAEDVLPETDDTSSRLLALVHATLAWPPAPPSVHRADVPPELDAIILKGLSKEQSKRYSSCRSMAHDLGRLTSSLQGLSTFSVDDVGVIDSLANMEFPDTLYGREEHTKTLTDAVKSALQGQKSLVVIEGPSGSGKTTLARTLIEYTAKHTGLWISLQPQLNSGRSFSVLADLLSGLLQPLLLLSAAEVEKWRAELLALGAAPLGFLLPFIEPEIVSGFGLSSMAYSSVRASEDFSNPLKKGALDAAVLRLISKVGSRFRPLVIFVDDCQWLQAVDLPLVEGIIDSLSEAPLGLLVVCARRFTDPIDFAQAAYHGSKLEGKLQSAENQIKLGALSSDDLFDLVSRLLGPSLRAGQTLGAARISTLWEIVHVLENTRMATPLGCRHILSSLKDRAALVFDWQSEMWLFHEELVEDEVGALRDVDPIGFLHAVLASQTSEIERSILLVATCLAGKGKFTPETIAIAMGQSGPEVDLAFSRLLLRKIFVLVSPQSAMNSQENSMTSLDSSNVIDINFAHAQWFEASRNLLDPNDAAAFYHGVAQRLHEATKDYSTLAAANMKLAYDLGFKFSHEQLPNLQSLLVKAAQVDLQHMKPEGALPLLLIGRSLADLLLNPPFSPRSMDLLLYEAYFQSNETASASTIADEIAASAGDDLEAINAVNLRLRCLSITDLATAIELLTSTMLKYAKVDLNEEAAAMGDRPMFRETAPDPWLPAREPPAHIAALQKMISDNIPGAYFHSPAYASAAMWLCVRLAQEHGAGWHVTKSLGGIMLFCCEVLNFGHARKWEAIADNLLVQTKASSYEVAGFRCMRDGSNHFLSASWLLASTKYFQTAIANYELSNIFALGWTCYDQAMYCMAQGALIGLYSSATLQAALEHGDHMGPKGRARSIHAYVFAAVSMQAAHNLMSIGSDILDPTIIAGKYVSEESWARYSRAYALHDLQWISYLFILKLVFGKSLWPFYVQHRHKAIEESHLMQNVSVLFSCGLAILEAIGAGRSVPQADLDRLDRIFNIFEEWTIRSECKQEFGAMLAMLHAARAVSRNVAMSEVLQAYDQAIEKAEGLHLLEAVAAEQAAKFIVSKTSSGSKAALGYYVHAYCAYHKWGAYRKCEALKEATSLLASSHLVETLEKSTALTSSHNKHASRFKSSPEASCASNATRSIIQSGGSIDKAPTTFDIATILATAHSWQTDSVDAMASSILKVLLQHCGAYYACLALMDERGLRIRAAGSATDLKSDLDLSLEDGVDIAPCSILEYVCRTRKIAPNKLLSLTTLSDKFLASRRPASFVGLPIYLQNTLAGVLYLDSPLPNAFSAADRSIISSLSTQAVLALERANQARSLESKVGERTAQLSQRNQELDSARRTAEDARDSETRFLRRMSHELRTPASSVIVLAGLLQECPNLEGIYREYVLQIKESSQALVSIISDLLDWGKLSSQQMVCEAIDFNLRDCIEAAIGTVAESASAKGIDLCYVTPIKEDTRWTLVGDEFRIKQILLNYLSNSIRFTSAGDFISVKTEVEELEERSPTGSRKALVKIGVHDNGIGIATAKHASLFKSFSQVDESITRIYGGSGLGLAISHSLAKLMGGDAWIDPSTDLGKGSMFWFKVVVQIGTILPPALTRPKLPSSKIQRISVLAPPIARDTIVSKLICFGIESQNIKVVNHYKSLLEEPFSDMYILNVLSARTDDMKILDQLSENQISKAFILIGLPLLKAPTKPYLILSDSRSVQLIRPPMTKTLFNTIKTAMGNASTTPREVQSSIPTQSLPILAKDYPIQIAAVDDNSVNRFVLKRILARLGYELTDNDMGSDGQTAVKLSNSNKYDLMLIDSEMPIQDGTSAMQEIRKQHGVRAPFMAVVTASAMPDDKQNFLAKGFDWYLPKPLMVDQLIELLKAAYSRKSKKNLTRLS